MKIFLSVSYSFQVDPEGVVFSDYRSELENVISPHEVHCIHLNEVTRSQWERPLDGWFPLSPVARQRFGQPKSADGALDTLWVDLKPFSEELGMDYRGTPASVVGHGVHFYVLPVMLHFGVEFKTLG